MKRSLYALDLLSGLPLYLWTDNPPLEYLLSLFLLLVKRKEAVQKFLERRKKKKAVWAVEVRETGELREHLTDLGEDRERRRRERLDCDS